jgi:ribosomal protein L1
MVRQHTGGRTYRMDKHGAVRVGLGKVSFEDSQLQDNLTAVLEALDTHRLVVGGRFVLGVHLTTTQARSCYPLHFERVDV